MSEDMIDIIGLIGFIVVVALVIILQHRESMAEIRAGKRSVK